VEFDVECDIVMSLKCEGYVLVDGDISVLGGNNPKDPICEFIFTIADNGMKKITHDLVSSENCVLRV
jgi:hypothetical protein